ncbi:hypothetical protein D3H55_20345 [Bacillus salacetis]|uniref:MEDS domain-containing protein n=1 Tax=Bacillus salacetis TaxID=2315464 RepID=A0A3A1QRM6_9BACI|nr:MEDS domain-containing protein [Bacillus salacetis]RIW28921.1 hypothetical protein D3H55_20345 [Bacillus salacetis]
MSKHVCKHVNSNTCTHILYCYKEIDSYMKNVMDYLVDGVESGESVLLIESERNLMVLEVLLKERLTDKQMQKVNRINNYEFYQSSGSYHPPAIYEQMNIALTPYFKNDIPFRTWTNVEWGTLENPSHIVDFFEEAVDHVVLEKDLTLVCAYDGRKMPEGLHETLALSHPHIMTDEDLVRSVMYKYRGSDAVSLLNEDPGRKLSF